jgi:hypothetical protein
VSDDTILFTVDRQSEMGLRKTDYGMAAVVRGGSKPEAAATKPNIQEIRTAASQTARLMRVKANEVHLLKETDYYIAPFTAISDFLPHISIGGG